MNIISVFQLLGGIGLFLYGMNLLSASLEKIAGASLERILEKLTSNKIKGVALGAGVTGIIQSSAASIIMVVGFLNAGIMKLSQAIPVIMGANIGTTVTGQILRLGDISDNNIFFAVLKPSSISHICIIAGVIIILFSKKKKLKDMAFVIIGLGILFLGMNIMESTLTPLKDLPSFKNLFCMFKDPILCVLLGIVVTAILQSSSASVGVLQAMSSTGVITFSIAAPIIIGQNLGKCVTVFISSIGTNKKAKRAVLIDAVINLIGAILFIFVIYGYQSIFGFSFWNNVVNRGNIANFHSLFNIATTVVLFPLCGPLIKFSAKVMKDNTTSKIENELVLLDDIFLKTPSLALEQCKKVILSMAESVTENFSVSCSLLKRHDDKKLATLDENEKFLDKSETVLTNYLIKITSKSISVDNSSLATEIIHTTGDLERIGDYCINIKDVAEFNRDQGIAFSKEAQKELFQIQSAVKNILDITVQAYKNSDLITAQRVEPLEEIVDLLEEMFKANHIARLKSISCTTAAGISFTELLTNMERIADHCSNIAVHIIKRLTKDESFDVHSHLKNVHEDSTEEYKALYQYYKNMYCTPLEKK